MKTRRAVKAMPKTPEKPKHHREEFPGRRDYRDQTVEMSREAVLAAASSEVLAMVDETTEFGVGLAEHGLDAYDIEDLVAPPPEATVANLIRHGVEEPIDAEDFFVDLDSLEQLSDTVVGAPSSEAIAENITRTQRIRMVNRLVARSRELARDEVEVAPEPVRQAWVFKGEPVAELASVEKAPRYSVWTSRLAGFGLAAIAGWAVATQVVLPVVFALILGAVSLLLLGGRSR